MAQNVTQYCHVCKSQTTSGAPVVTLSLGCNVERAERGKTARVGIEEFMCGMQTTLFGESLDWACI